ncbi:MAG: N-acetylmuramoyl-L-alanine amidase [Campylobacteraceae bacterium]|jgi:N-acetylmuramoyl-L-alanine amidase|nr:N-acetylmuramoyl-L-alanine amidase [Campylobacteraceae bacterium]
MTIKKFIFLLLTMLSFALAGNAVFDEFDNSFSSYSQTQKEKIYAGIKHIYIESIVNNNDELKYESLTRLIDGSKTLGYDYSLYEKELNTLKNSPNVAAIASTPKSTVTSQTRPAKSTLEDNSSVFALDMVRIEQNTAYVKADDVSVPAQTNTVYANVPAQTNTVYANAPAQTSTTGAAKLTGAKQDGESVIFQFDQKIDGVKFLKLKGDTFRYIYDVKAIKTNALIELNIDGIKDLRVSQFDKDTLRIVFEYTKDIEITYESGGEELIFKSKEFNPKGSKTVNPTQPTPPPSSNNSVKNTTVPKTNTTAPKGTVPRKTIVIDAGHGGKDSGAVADKKYEKDAVLQIALLLGGELEKRGHKVYYTRTKDVYLQLRERTKAANDRNADIFISVHANAAPKKSPEGKLWQGIETFFLSPTDSKRSKNAAELENQSDVDEMNFYSKQTFLNFLNREKIIASHKMAIDIQQYILNNLKKNYTSVVDGGVREAPFWVLTGAQMPAVLLEVGYITDKTDRERMFDTKFQQILVVGLANGIESYFLKNM